MLAGNLRYTFRSFRKNPGFTAIAVRLLALGIGANTAIFSLLDRVILRSLPVRDPQQLVYLHRPKGRAEAASTPNYDDTFTFSYPMYHRFPRSRARSVRRHRVVSDFRQSLAERHNRARRGEPGLGKLLRGSRRRDGDRAADHLR